MLNTPAAGVKRAREILGHGEMLPGQLLDERPGPRRFGGVEGLYLAGSGAHPGGAVTGCPGYLAARAVAEDLTRALDVGGRRI
jgi:phytoene dehydrogenase-like protein